LWVRLSSTETLDMRHLRTRADTLRTNRCSTLFSLVNFTK
jgi:hypothetical protein